MGMNKRSRPRNLRRLSLGLLAAGLALAGTGVLEQRLRMERDAAEYDQWRVTLKHTPAAVTAEATPAPLNASSTAALFPAYLLPVTAMPEASGAPGATGKVEASSAASEAGTGTRANLTACLAQNADFGAWLQIPGTNVDHPVVRTGNPGLLPDPRLFREKEFRRHVVLAALVGLPCAQPQPGHLWPPPELRRRKDVHLAHAL